MKNGLEETGMFQEEIKMDIRPFADNTTHT